MVDCAGLYGWGQELSLACSEHLVPGTCQRNVLTHAHSDKASITAVNEDYTDDNFIGGK